MRELGIFDLDHPEMVEEVLNVTDSITDQKNTKRGGLMPRREINSIRAHGLLRDGDRVFLRGNHPFAPNVGTLIAYEKYGLGWWGWRVRLDNPAGQETYATENNLKKAGRKHV
jgi:hypothetical protein